MAKFKTVTLASRSNHETQDQVIMSIMKADDNIIFKVEEHIIIFKVEEHIHEGHCSSIGHHEIHSDAEDALELFMTLGDELECDLFIHLMAYDENGHLNDSIVTGNHNNVLTFGQ